MSYDKALALAPDDADILISRANALAMLERFAEAEAVYSAVIARSPKLALASAHKALAVKEQGRFAEARKLFEQTLAIAPDDHMSAYALARLMLAMGDWRNAWPLSNAAPRCRNLLTRRSIIRAGTASRPAISGWCCCRNKT